ncbi:DNA-binding GntR family transcriptional regulator [Cricetibacter osteomyelitidis]|uniref:DNA-binding GntR family transcriptional regulator n=1 Tax=Cricetibacter osteomyelitidis TaxID=1521931 RepID=A0A4R2T4X2_9PAST|nr:GntR family transcriptional regulator [Cricetibacter osteomyelitidis]TCP96571.1 DNA-binding GntR family transcriptional regulator [Cricetibacter osteomyelitidis]
MNEPKKRESSREFAYRMIREMIVNMELKPGNKVSETELATLLGLSRTPIREALIDLEKSGVVRVISQKGTFISYIDPLLIEEARFLRLTLEKEVASQLCEEQYQEHLYLLEDNVKLQEFYLNNENYEKFLELDNEFHRLFFQLTNNMNIYKLMSGLNIHFDRARVAVFKNKPSLKTIVEHRNILSAMKKQDKDQVKEYIEAHLYQYILDKDRFEKEYSQYFNKSDD